MRFETTELTAGELALQQQVRAFLESELPRGGFEPGLGMGARSDPEFSRKLGERGWIGMALPRRYGGGDRSAVERFVIVEELLRWGAPVGYHWIADRQSGPLIARFGTEQQKERFLPPICRGELAFAIGMSEPDSGSDLASVKTRAIRTEGGWLVNGTKIWTSGAHHHDWMIALVRTGDEEDRHAGLSQLLVDLRAPGLRISPIPFLDGTSDFNEISLADVFVSDEEVVGALGMGWSQIGAELAFERSGPERWLSTYLVLEQYLRERIGGSLDGQAPAHLGLDGQAPAQLGLGGPAPALLGFDGPAPALLGRASARIWGLRNLSLSIARSIDGGGSPAAEAALVKEMGTRFEQDLLEEVRILADIEPSPSSGSLFERLLATAILAGPSFTIRGGTVEILRSVAAKELPR